MDLSETMTSKQKVTRFRDFFRPIMDHNGFQWMEGAEVDNHGKPWAWGQYVNGFRKLRFAICPESVLIKYHMGRYLLEHEDMLFHSPDHKSRLDRGELLKDLDGQLAFLHDDVAVAGKRFLEGDIERLMKWAQQKGKLSGNEMKNK